VRSAVIDRFASGMRSVLVTWPRLLLLLLVSGVDCSISDGQLESVVQLGACRAVVNGNRTLIDLTNVTGR